MEAHLNLWMWRLGNRDWPWGSINNKWKCPPFCLKNSPYLYNILTTQLHTKCCIAGGGPAGIMLGYLLARAGIEVIVIEKHADFRRDFRGDTIHPSTMQIMYELGLLEEFLQLPHQELRQLNAQYYDTIVPIADFGKLKVAKPVLGFMPQWDFLNFLAGKAAAFKTFKILMGISVTDLIWENNCVKGVMAIGANDKLEIHADLVFGTDGRRSKVRELAGLKVADFHVPIDVLCFRLPKDPTDETQSFGRFYNGRVLVMVNRGTYWQCDYVINKNEFNELKKNGLEAFRQQLTLAGPFLAEGIKQLSWGDIHSLTVSLNRLRKWYVPGLLCIGDAAHAMSPVGGVGINLAIEDAVATANILVKTLKSNVPVTPDLLHKVQQKRMFPTWIIQLLQVFIHKGIVRKRSAGNTRLPFEFLLLKKLPFLRRIPAYFIGMGVRAEHVSENIR